MSEEEETFIRRMFESYDVNENGVLDREEFYKVFKSMVKQLSDNQTEEELDVIAGEAIVKFDLNKNGIIEYNEFKELVRFLIDEKGLSVNNYWKISEDIFIKWFYG